MDIERLSDLLRARMRDSRHSQAIAGLVGGNLLLMVSYLFGWITAAELLWSYWLQSVAIGFFNYRRMMGLDRFSTENLKSNGQPVPNTPEGKRSTARFFALHYGIFHVVYAGFISMQTPSGSTWLWVALAASGFVSGEFSTYRRHRATDPLWEPDLGTIMFQPYLRIIPMHFAIMTFTLAGAVLLPLKLFADIGMYLVDEHLEAKRLQAAGASDRPLGTEVA